MIGWTAEPDAQAKETFGLPRCFAFACASGSAAHRVLPQALNSARLGLRSCSMIGWTAEPDAQAKETLGQPRCFAFACASGSAAHRVLPQALNSARLGLRSCSMIGWTAEPDA